MGRKRPSQVSKNQIGFYLDEADNELHVRPQTGDLMIRPDIEKERKPKILNPWAEAMGFIKQQHHVGDLIRAEVGYPDGGVEFFDANGEHASGIGERYGEPFIITAEFVQEPRLDTLSTKGKSVYFALKNKEGR